METKTLESDAISVDPEQRILGTSATLIYVVVNADRERRRKSATSAHLSDAQTYRKPTEPAGWNQILAIRASIGVFQVVADPRVNRKCLRKFRPNSFQIVIYRQTAVNSECVVAPENSCAAPERLTKPGLTPDLTRFKRKKAEKIRRRENLSLLLSILSGILYTRKVGSWPDIHCVEPAETSRIAAAFQAFPACSESATCRMAVSSATFLRSLRRCQAECANTRLKPNSIPPMLARASAGSHVRPGT